MFNLNRLRFNYFHVIHIFGFYSHVKWKVAHVRPVYCWPRITLSCRANLCGTWAGGTMASDRSAPMPINTGDQTLARAKSFYLTASPGFDSHGPKYVWSLLCIMAKQNHEMVNGHQCLFFCIGSQQSKFNPIWLLFPWRCRNSPYSMILIDQCCKVKLLQCDCQTRAIYEYMLHD